MLDSSRPIYAGLQMLRGGWVGTARGDAAVCRHWTTVNGYNHCMGRAGLWPALMLYITSTSSTHPTTEMTHPTTEMTHHNHAMTRPTCSCVFCTMASTSFQSFFPFFLTDRLTLVAHPCANAIARLQYYDPACDLHWALGCIVLISEVARVCACVCVCVRVWLWWAAGT